MKEKPFHNKYGYIKLGTPVRFEVENQDMWYGDLTGVLAYEDGEYVIKTENSGTLATSGYLSVYWNTIQPLIINQLS